MKFFYCTIIIAALVFNISIVRSQGVTTAAINGIVKDKSGKGLIGATVVALHEPTGTKYGARVSTGGRFYIQGLRVGGPYTVTASMVSYKPEKQSNVSLRLSQNLNINFTLSEANIQTNTVEVVAEKNSVLSSGRTGATQNVSKEQIESFPTISRSFQDFTKFSPQMTSTNGGTSAGGRNNRYNNIQIDGTQYSDLFGLGASGTPGSQTQTNPISLDAIQEFQVVISPYDVRQGRFTGGGINAVTRSGTNKFEGSAYYFFRNQGMVGDLNTTRYNIAKDATGSPIIGTYTDSTIKTPFANFSEYQVGFRLGGPIIENDLFFFVNAELTGKKQPYENIAFTQNSSAAMIRSIADTVSQILQNTYNYKPGSTGTFEAERPSTKLFARLDWNISDNHKLTFRQNYVDASNDVFIPGINAVLFSSRNYNIHSKVSSSVLQLNSIVSTDMTNELILGYTQIDDNREITGNPFPTIIVRDSRMGTASITAGSENFSNKNQLSQSVIELTDNLTYLTGDHIFTLGTQNEIFTFKNLFIRDYYGTYTFNTLNDFRNGVAGNLVYSFTRPGIDPDFAAKFGAMQLGFYLQDEWSVMSNLKLNIGIRADIPIVNDKPAYNISADTIKYNANTLAFQNNPTATFGLKTNEVPKSTLLFSPRIGFNYDVSNDKSSIIRGGVGVFTGRVPYVWISNQFGNTGVEFARLNLNTRPQDTVRFNQALNPRDSAFLKRAGTATEIDVTSADFKMPQIARLNLGFDQELPWGITGTIDAIYSKTLNDIYYTDANLGDRLDTNALGAKLPGGRGVYGTYSGRNTTRRLQVGTGAGPITNAIVLSNTSEGYQYSVSVQLQKQFDNGFFASAAYTMGGAKDQNSGTSSQALSQWAFNYVTDNPNHAPLTRSLFDIPNRVIANMTYKYTYSKNFSTSISFFYEGNSGVPFTYVYDGDVNADGNTGNDIIYVPKDRNDITLIRTGATQTRAPGSDYDALNSYIDRDDYLKTVRGQIAERNGAREPWAQRFDLRIAQEIPNIALDDHKLEITFDILNFFNLHNSEWGRVRSVNLNRDLLLRFEGLAQAGNKLGENDTEIPKGTPLFSYIDKKNPFQFNDLVSRYQMQLGIRYSF